MLQQKQCNAIFDLIKNNIVFASLLFYSLDWLPVFAKKYEDYIMRRMSNGSTPCRLLMHDLSQLLCLELSIPKESSQFQCVPHLTHRRVSFASAPTCHLPTTTLTTSPHPTQLYRCRLCPLHKQRALCAQQFCVYFPDDATVCLV